MDHSPVAFEDGVDAERMRMNSFSFGKPKSPSDASMASKPTRHSRSHSRNSSVSVPPPLSFAPPAPTLSSSTSTSSPSPPQSPTRNSMGGSKRNSHHRRRSSVSTRRESADLMGISLPALPTTSPEDNINLGDKDSVRRRALWALEGKTPVGNFSVEIPELDAPEAPKRSFDFPSKPSFPPGVGAGFSGGLNTLMGSKRDSKFMASSSSSEILGTLVEEEEEEEDEESREIISSPVQESSEAADLAVTVTSPSPAATRHRPASLNLRPLSLALSSSLQASSAESTLPSPTPSPRPGLKSLTLPSSQSLSGFSSNASSNKRQSLIMSSSPVVPSTAFGRRPSLNLSTDSTNVVPPPNRRSSISYVSSGDAQSVSIYGLPTPEMTPTSSTIDRRRSTSISSNGSVDVDQLRGRPLSVTEQHFLFQAHQTLVQRITDLERALKRSGPRSRPVSCASDASSASTALSEPSDEMLQLIADLKAERDELKKDVDGWRNRVADMERQIDVHAKRLEVERRDAWVARQRLGLLEVEKSTLEKTLADKTAQADELQSKCDAVQQDFQKAQQEIARLNAEVERKRAAEDEASQLRAELAQERKKREELERELEQAGLLDTPRPFSSVTNSAANVVSRTMMYAKSRGLGFRSIDSDFTDVDSVDENRGPELKAVEEVDEDDHDSMYDDDDDALAGYEDEDENDEYAFPTSSSYGSVVDYSRSSTPRLSSDSADSTVAPALTISRSPSVSPSPLPSPAELPATHARHASLSKAWSFPANSGGVTVVQRQPEEIDRFFGCLEDVDNSPPIDSKLRSVESGKNLFSQALAEYEEDLPPFVIPADVGEVIASPEIEVEVSQHTLDVVLEEEEEEEEEEEDQEEDDSHDAADEEFVGEEDEGGIKFVFDPPPSDYCPDLDADTSTPDLTMASTPDSVNKSGQFFEPMEDDDADSSFTFPQLKTQRSNPLPSAIPRLRSPSPSKLPMPPTTASTPVKAASALPLTRLGSPVSFSTPPPKRTIVAAPTFIPQPRNSVPQTPSPPSQGKVASFIPQPKRAAASPRPSAIPVMSPPISSTLPSSTSFASPPIPSRPTRLPRLQL
ncbi:hypothetical protein FKP32DRAFT_1651102 [Trametes sanguinea]|nr:hypothetical protein FKP32DRAFT_1651102 [Trametes sanguinea]